MAPNIEGTASLEPHRTMTNKQGEASLNEERIGTSQKHSLLIESGANDGDDDEENKPTNECVLNVAFFSFLGFTLVQTGFALAAHSSAMLADSAAMFVDALTYLFNLLAERLKSRPYSEREKRMPAHVRHYKRRLHRLYLELVPPLISVSTLIVVTIFAFRDSLTVLLGKEMVNASNEPNVDIMLLFSALNLGLDAVNVTCFARAGQSVGFMTAAHEIPEAHHQHSENIESDPTEVTPLKASATGTSPVRSVVDTDSETYYSETGTEDSGGLNLNMCSAWTHVYADTMRSLAVLIAAGIAFVWPGLSPEVADASASFMVSVIIVVSLAPLIQGLYYTAMEIREMTAKGHTYPAEVNLVV